MTTSIIPAASSKQVALLEKLGVKAFIGNSLQASQRISELLNEAAKEPASSKQTAWLDYHGGKKVDLLTKREASLWISLISAVEGLDKAKSKVEKETAVELMVAAVRKNCMKFRPTN